MSLAETFKDYIQNRISRALGKPVEDIDFSELTLAVTVVTKSVGWNTEETETVINVAMDAKLEGETVKRINFNVSLNDVDFMLDDILTGIVRG